MERPILMMTESVKTILDGRKTMTRRLSKLNEYNLEPDDWLVTPSLNPSVWAFYKMASVGVKDLVRIPCPYGQVGDRLWVRETWRIESFMDGEPLLFSYKDGQTMEENTTLSDTPDYEGWYERVCIQSTEEASQAFKQGLVQREEGGPYLWDIGESPCRWRPSIFMPRWASRILLEITGLRAERLQEITEEDCYKEGLDLSIGMMLVEPHWMTKDILRRKFKELWDSLNAKRGYGWDKNPWVWVIKFGNIGVR